MLERPSEEEVEGGVLSTGNLLSLLIWDGNNIKMIQDLFFHLCGKKHLVDLLPGALTLCVYRVLL